jgi:hypothetical protein
MSNSSKAVVLSASDWSLTRQLNQTSAIPHLKEMFKCDAVSQSLALPVSIFVVYDPMAITTTYECFELPILCDLWLKFFLKSFAHSFHGTFI